MLYPVLQDPLHQIVSSLFDRPRGASIGQMLFGAGEQGAWYDVADMSTLFQDAAGATPVTAVEQQVGRMLDKSGRGNHATQVTATKWPKYSRRVNLYASTENLSSVWTLTGATVTASGTSPTGSAAWLMSDSAVTSVHTAGQQATVTNARHLLRLLAKPQGGQYVYLQVGNGVDRGNAVFDLHTATVTASSSSGLGAVSFSISVLTDGWLSLSASAVIDAGIRSFWFGICSGPSLGDISFLGDNTRTILFAEPSLTLATDAHLPYQRVNTATDYDADPSKFPAYLRYDGVDDALQTGNIDFTGTDKMTVWVGYAKINDGPTSVFLEAGSLYTGGGGIGAFSSDGSSAVFGFAHSDATGNKVLGLVSAATEIGLITSRYDLQSGAKTSARKNSGAWVFAPASGGGFLGNRPLYIGARAGTSFFFNGRLYSLIVRGAQSSLSQIEATEAYIKQKMRLP